MELPTTVWMRVVSPGSRAAGRGLICNQRFLAFLSSLDDPSAGERDLQRLSQPRVGTDPSVKGLNFFDVTEQTLLRTLQHGEFNIHGWRRADLLAYLHTTPWAMSRQLKRFRLLGLIKKVAHTYRYYLTRMGRAAIAAACSLTRFNLSPPWLLRIEFFA